MTLYFLLVTCLIGFAVAGIPSYIKICYQDDPKLNQCVKESIEALRPKLAEGMPELDVPTLEPLHIPQIELANSPSFKAAAQMVKFYDFTKFKIESLDIDLEKGTIFVILRFDKIRLDAQYAVNAKLGPAIIAGKGPIDIIATGVKAIAKLKMEKVTRKGREAIYFSSMTTKLTIEDYTSKFTPSQGDDALAVVVDSTLENNKQEILKRVIPNIESAIPTIVLDAGNKICKNFYFDELFPIHK